MERLRDITVRVEVDTNKRTRVGTFIQDSDETVAELMERAAAFVREVTEGSSE